MNEQACAFVCILFSVFGAVLSGYWMKTGDGNIVSLITVFVLVVVLLSGFVIAYRHG